jgi:hypothetical protein
MHPLVEEAAKKAAVAWVGFGDGPAYCVWVLPLEGRLYVITGPGEQQLPGLADALAAGVPAAVTLRGDHGGTIVTFAAAITEIRSNGTEWEAVAPQLANKRLNASGAAEDLTARWAAECLLVSLTPQEDAVAADLSGKSAYQPPRPASVVRATRKPFRLHKVKKR